MSANEANQRKRRCAEQERKTFQRNSGFTVTFFSQQLSKCASNVLFLFLWYFYLWSSRLCLKGYVSFLFTISLSLFHDWHLVLCLHAPETTIAILSDAHSLGPKRVRSWMIACFRWLHHRKVKEFERATKDMSLSHILRLNVAQFVWLSWEWLYLLDCSNSNICVFQISIGCVFRMFQTFPFGLPVKEDKTTDAKWLWSESLEEHKTERKRMRRSILREKRSRLKVMSVKRSRDIERGSWSLTFLPSFALLWLLYLFLDPNKRLRGQTETSRETPVILRQMTLLIEVNKWEN